MALNLFKIINKNTFNIIYNIKINNKKKNYCNLYYNGIEFLKILNSLCFIYLYLYKYIISTKQKILISNNSFYYLSWIKYMTYITNTYYIYTKSNLELFTNIIMLKKSLILYKWLEYFLFYNLILKKSYKNKFLINRIYIIYLKLKLNYSNLKQLDKIPNLLLFLIINDNKILKNLKKLRKNIIIISNNKYKYENENNNIYVLSIKNINFSIIYIILKIIFTSIFHGVFSNK